MQTEEHSEIQESIHENTKLLKENNKLLRRLHRSNMIALLVQILWYALLIGLPFALYFYFLEPYFEAFGSSFETFQAGINEIPGVKAFESLRE